MGIKRKKFSSQAKSSILKDLKDIAESEGRQFQAVLEEAMQDYIVKKKGESPRDKVMAHFQASVVKNRRLGELLSK